MNKFNLSLLLILLVIVTASVPGFSADNPDPIFIAQSAEDENQLQISAVEPLKGTVGKDLKVTITGDGFGSTSRVALIPQPYHDYPRLDANDFTSPCFNTACGEVDWIEAHGNLLFTFRLIGEGREISIADLSNPIMPIKTGTFSIQQRLCKIALEGHYAYLVTSVHYKNNITYSLQIIDLSDLSNPKPSGEIQIDDSWVGAGHWDRTVDLDIKNKTVYITRGWSGLRVVDASVPSTPQIIATYDNNDLKSNNINAFSGIEIDGDNAYIAAGDSGMAVMDISNPAEPSLVKVINTSGDCRDVAVSGQTAYAVNREGMVSIDITTPSDPHIGGALPLYGHVIEIQIKGNYAWVFAPEGGQYHMVDIRRPLFPVLAASASMDLLNDPEAYNFMTLSGNMAYVQKNNCLMLAPIPLELSDITLNSSSSLSFTIPAPLINARYKIRVFDDLHSAESQQTLSFEFPPTISDLVVDYPDQAIKTIIVDGYSGGVFFTPDGKFAYVPTYVDNRIDDTISVIRISDHSVIKNIVAYIAPGKIIFSPDGDYAYVQNSLFIPVVLVINTSDDSIVKTFKNDDYHSDMLTTPDGSFLYVTNSLGNSVSVIRTSDHTITGTIPVGTRPSQLCIRPDGAYIYALSNSDNSISVIRSSDNQVETTIPVEGGPTEFVMTPNGAYIYVLTESGYAIVIQTSDNTVIKKIPGVGRSVVKVTPDGGHVYAGGRGDGICVIQTSDQTIEKTIQKVCLPSLMAMTPKGDYLYFANGYYGDLFILRTSDNKIVKTIPLGPINGMAVTPDGKYVYVSTSENTVTVLANSHDIDDDADGFTENQGDCDDSDPLIIPVPEICGDGIDQDCDGQDQVCCAITVTSPNGGEVWKPGSVHQITWNSAGSECGPSLKIAYSTDGGGSWHEISAECPNTGALAWTIPDPFETNQAKIKIEDTSDAGYFDISDADFMIRKNNCGDGQDQACCAITVTSPNGGETWKPGSVHQITWNSAGSECGPSVKITYSTDGGVTWHEISAECPNTGAFSWTIPDPFEANQAIIKIEDTSDADYFDISDAEFMIQKNNGGGGGGCFISGMF
jgi:YVTN family beta-propeller protein